MRTHLVMSVAVVSLIVVFAFAQSPQAEIRGTVTDVVGAALPGVLVTLTGPVQGSTVTDKNGQYAFQNLRAGTYEVRFALKGFQTASAHITVSNRLEQVNVRLSPGTGTENLSAQSQAGEPMMEMRRDYNVGGLGMRIAAVASAVAEVGMLLRGSKHGGSGSFASAIRRATQFRGGDSEGYRSEFVKLAGLASSLRGVQMSNRSISAP